MGRFSEHMLRLYSDIMQDHAERQQLLRKLNRFAIHLNKDVNAMLNNINQSRITRSDNLAKERKLFVSCLRRQIITLRRNLANELQQIREARLAITEDKRKITKNNLTATVISKTKRKSISD